MLAAKLSYARFARLFLLVSFALGAAQIIEPTLAQGAILQKDNCGESTPDYVCAASGKIEYVFIYDEIDRITAIKFALLAGKIPLNVPFPKVYISSRGGSPIAARQIGRILRERSATIEGRDMISPDREPICASACVEVAVGGVKRNFISLHVHKGHLTKRLKGETYQIKQMPESELQAMSAYFKEMRISDELSLMIDATGPDREWTYITYDAGIPLKNQQIYKLGFLMDEKVGVELNSLRARGDGADWNASAARQKQADAGDGYSAYILGYRYLWGIAGVKKSQEKSNYWMQKAGDLGYAAGYHSLGVSYLDEREVGEVDEKKSTEYFRKASELGFSGSENNLAWAYYKGRGVSKNIAEAIYWATRSAEQGEPFAYSTLAEIRFEGNGFQHDDVETLKWTILAINEMPDGASKKSMEKQSDVLRRRMSQAQISEATEKSKNWKPLVNGGPTMRDKDDK